MKKQQQAHREYIKSNRKKIVAAATVAALSAVGFAIGVAVNSCCGRFYCCCCFGRWLVASCYLLAFCCWLSLIVYVGSERCDGKFLRVRLICQASAAELRNSQSAWAHENIDACFLTEAQAHIIYIQVCAYVMHVNSPLTAMFCCCWSRLYWKKLWNQQPPR